jgi:hypothetical protein
MYHLGKLKGTRNFNYLVSFVCHFLGDFVQGSANDFYIGLHFSRPFLGYEAEKSAAWEHWTTLPPAPHVA